MRQLTDHKVNPANDLITVTVIDPPGEGNASHVYQCKVPNGQTITINFQNGPINMVGVNGLTQEVLLAIVADRLQSFQKGSFSCRENALALTKIEEAMHWLHHRTLRRMQAGTEGTRLPD